MRGWRPFLLCLTLSTLTSAAFATDLRPKVVGTNLTGLSPVSSAWDFADLMKASNTWNSGAVATSTYNADNWPILIPAGQTLGTNVRLPVNRLIPNIPLGTYTLT